MREYRFSFLLEGPNALLGVTVGEIVHHDIAPRLVGRLQAQLQLLAVEPLAQRNHLPRFAGYCRANPAQLCLKLRPLNQLKRRPKIYV